MQINRITPALRVLANGLEFPEGPIALGDGSVLLVEMRRQTLTRVTAAGAVEVVAELGGGPNGAAIGPDGRVYVTNNGGPNWIAGAGVTMLPVGAPPDAVGCVQVVELAGGRVDTLYETCDGQPIGAPNDLVFDAEGGFWFTDFGRFGTARSGGVYYAQADGSRIERRIFPLEHPNGIGLSPDGRRLYVAETPTARLWAFDLAGPGRLASGERRLLAALGDYQHLDSLAVDAEGHICVATLVSGAVSDIWPDGSRIDQHMLPDPIVTNVCFGGPERSTAIATLSMHGRLVAFDWPRPGSAPNFVRASSNEVLTRRD